jgi:hypothetical protein
MAAKYHVVERGTINRIPLPESLLEERLTRPRPDSAAQRKKLIHLVPRLRRTKR